jgi:hypothetical protein
MMDFQGSEIQEQEISLWVIEMDIEMISDRNTERVGAMIVSKSKWQSLENANSIIAPKSQLFGSEFNPNCQLHTPVLNFQTFLSL